MPLSCSKNSTKTCELTCWMIERMGSGISSSSRSAYFFWWGSLKFCHPGPGSGKASMALCTVSAGSRSSMMTWGNGSAAMNTGCSRSASDCSSPRVGIDEVDCALVTPAT